jgi:hypothetical protein
MVGQNKQQAVSNRAICALNDQSLNEFTVGDFYAVVFHTAV